MLSSKKEPVSGAPELPNELVCEILTWLPGKKIGRCRCVCKAWRAMIAGRPFREIYRERQRGLIFYRSTMIDRDDGKLAHRHKFFHCPLRRLLEPPEEFRPLPVIDTEAIMMGAVYLTQLVDGLLCVGESGGVLGLDFRLTLHNIGTGETMKLPDPLTCYSRQSTYHLGYDRTSGEYKVLRLIFGSSDSIQGAHILTLRPPSASHISMWRVLDNGLRIPDFDFLSEVRQFCDDGVVCWTHYSLKSEWEHLLCFDFSKEKFRFVELPRDGIYTRFLGLTWFNGSLALWLEYGKTSETRCYLLRDGEEEEEGEKWSRQNGEVSRYFEEIGGSVVASGKFPGSSSSNSDIMVMSLDPFSENLLSRVYPYCWGKSVEDKEEVFFVGELPDGAFYHNDDYPYHYWESFSDASAEVHCLLDSNHLYLSLDHILASASSASSATML